MSSPSVTVVIPALNEESVLGSLLRCLEQQTVRPVQTLVVDGGSSDRTSALASCWRGVTVLHAEPPVGRQRQAGLEAACGDVCIFVDADTTLSCDFLERSVIEMRRRRLSAACPRYMRDGASVGVRATFLWFNMLFTLLQSVLPSGGGACLVAETEAARAAGGFNPDLVYDDIEFIRRVGRRGRFGILSTYATISARRFARDGVLRTAGTYALLSLFFTVGAFRLAEVVRYRFSSYPTVAQEWVVLVDYAGEPVGTASKDLVHTAGTPLHRGFSLFVFDRQGRVLLQQRSAAKRTWPLEWSNSCCGHPQPGESSVEAAYRRLREELGMAATGIREILPNYRYSAIYNGICEQEVCPVLIGIAEGEPSPDPSEVAAIEWVDWDALAAAVRSRARRLTPWCEEEVSLLCEQYGDPYDAVLLSSEHPLT